MATSSRVAAASLAGFLAGSISFGGTPFMEGANAKPCQVTLLELRDRSREFAAQRDWEQYHTPRNLALAMVGEVGELCECFQWKGEVEPGLKSWSEQERTHLGVTRSKRHNCSSRNEAENGHSFRLWPQTMENAPRMRGY